MLSVPCSAVGIDVVWSAIFLAQHACKGPDTSRRGVARRPLQLCQYRRGRSTEYSGGTAVAAAPRPSRTESYTTPAGLRRMLVSALTGIGVQHRDQQEQCQR